MILKEKDCSWNVDIELPKITRERAIQIVTDLVGKDNLRHIEVLRNIPKNIYCHEFDREQLSANWVLLVFDGPSGILKSSRLICICNSTGKILFDGSANDEG